MASSKAFNALNEDVHCKLSRKKSKAAKSGKKKDPLDRELDKFLKKMAVNDNFDSRQLSLPGVQLYKTGP